MGEEEPSTSTSSIVPSTTTPSVETTTPVMEAGRMITMISKNQQFSGQFIGRPQTFVELQLHFKLHFRSVKMQWIKSVNIKVP